MRVRYIPYIKILGGLILGGYLLYGGVSMIFEDISASNPITVKLFGMEVSATSLGVIVIAIGAVIVISTIRWRIAKRGEDMLLAVRPNETLLWLVISWLSCSCSFI